MATYPTTLPSPVADYSLDPADQTLRTDMDVGAARVRRRTTTRNDMTQVKWVFTDAQFATFRAWFDNATTGAAGGAAWFFVRLPAGTGGVVQLEARFKGPFKAAALGALVWSVSAELELRYV